MAIRNETLLRLVQSGVSGDREKFDSIVRLAISEEEKKNNTTLAHGLRKIVERSSKAAPKASMVLMGKNGQPDDSLLSRVPEKSLESLALSDLNRRSCDELVEEHRHVESLRENGLEPRHKILLSGPPGNGKTSLAEAMADALSLPFITVQYEGVIKSHLGESSTLMRRIFDHAASSPCVLFFDEFDTVGKERSSGNDVGEVKRLVSSLLMYIDGLPSHTVVVVATNHGDMLDRAIWRRFQLRLSVLSPTGDELSSFMKQLMEKHGETLTDSAAERIARDLGSVSYAEMTDFCHDILRRHVIADRKGDISDIAAQCVEFWNARSGPEM